MVSPEYPGIPHVPGIPPVPRGRRGKASLEEAVAEVLKAAGGPMRLTAVADAVKAAGYESKAKRFDKMVHKALNNLATAKRVGRRLYVNKA